MGVPEPDEQRADSREMWEQASAGWGKRADRIRDWGLPVSMVMVDALALQPGQRVLELAAGPGDTGFMAAELIEPGGTLVCTDGAEAMLEVARRRAHAAGITNVEFRQLELEWIDLEAATVDAVLCRWGIMLIVDPESGAREIRRVLRTGGRAAFAVWDTPDLNPWATIPSAVMIRRGHAERPDPQAPGMFRLAAPGLLADLLESVGFTDVVVKPVALTRHYERVQDFLEETRDISPLLRSSLSDLPPAEQNEIADEISTRVSEYADENGSVTLPGSSLVAVATA